MSGAQTRRQVVNINAGEYVSVHRKWTDQNLEFPINFVLQDGTTNQLLTEIKLALILPRVHDSTTDNFVKLQCVAPKISDRKQRPVPSKSPHNTLE